MLFLLLRWGWEKPIKVINLFPTRNVKHVRNQKLFGCIGSHIRGLLPLLSNVTVTVNRGKRCKPKKNNGIDHVMQALAAKLCSHKSLYKMTETKTPKTLKRMDIHFLEKSTHYDNIENINIDSVWRTNSLLIQQNRALAEQPIIMLDWTPGELWSKKYEAGRDGYIGRKQGESITGNCHQLFSATLAGQKLFSFELRCPGNYNAFSNPKAHKDRRLSGLNFNETIAKYVVEQAHKILPNKRFLWVFDRGFDCHEFWGWLKKIGDDFVTSADKTAECVKQPQRLIDSEQAILKKADGFDYYETLVHVEEMPLKAVYIQPHDNTPAYWLLTTKLELKGPEAKRLYNKRSGDEPMYDYLKNDYNAKKPCKKSFKGAQAYTALLCLVHNMISLLSQEIFNAYHRLNTLTAFISELTALESLFQPAPKNTSSAPPPNNAQPSACKI